MRREFIAASVVVMLLAGVSSASAQQDYRVGLVVGYPASVGVLWHVSDGVALRPDVAINRQSNESTSTVSIGFSPPQTSTSTTSGWNTSLGLSALFYLGPPADLRFYLTPRVAYQWSRTETETSPALPQLVDYESESDGFLVAGSFGAQYAPHDRFRLFGEVGLSYSEQEGETGFTLARQSLKTSSFGLRSGIGVVVFF
jgi:Autotransporter beta-domain